MKEYEIYSNWAKSLTPKNYNERLPVLIRACSIYLKIKEQWVPCFINEDCYEVSNFGRIRSLTRKRWNGVCWCNLNGRYMRAYAMPKNYPTVAINTEDKTGYKTKLIHLIYMKSATPKSEWNENVNHKDLNKLNNAFFNLEWVTRKQNQKHAYDNGAMIPPPYTNKGSLHHGSKPVIQLSLDGLFISRYCSVWEAHEKTGISSEKIGMVCNKKRNKSGGFKWIYESEYIYNKEKQLAV